MAAFIIPLLALTAVISPAAAVMTITVVGDGKYGVAETVRFTGMNTDDFTTYLFITGPDLDAGGVTLTNSYERAVDGFFTTAAVDPLNRTWTYEWVPGSLVGKKPTGTYTVFAVGSPVPYTRIAGVAHGRSTIVVEGAPTPAPGPSAVPATTLPPAFTPAPSSTGIPAVVSPPPVTATGSPVGTLITVWPGSAVTVTKTAGPSTIVPGETAVVNITVQNPTTLLFSEIVVADTVPPGCTVTGGITGISFQYLRPGEAHAIGYTIRPEGPGRCVLPPATVRLRDYRGNYHTIQSDSPAIEVLPPVSTPSDTTAPRAPGLCAAGAAGALALLCAWAGLREGQGN